MSFFAKVSSNFIDSDLEFLKQFKSNDLTMDFVGPGTHLEYFLLTDYPEYVKLHTKQICKIEPTGILYSQISGQGLLGAHIDHGPLVALNYYIDAGFDETVFFEKKSEDIPSERYGDYQESNIFNFHDLIPKDRFIANTGDTYLLNVSKIHAVIKKTNITRQFISYQWYEHTFEEIKENLLI